MYGRFLGRRKVIIVVVLLFCVFLLFVFSILIFVVIFEVVVEYNISGFVINFSNVGYMVFMVLLFFIWGFIS